MQTVFVVDDDPSQVELTEICLTRAGFRVRGFCDPFAAFSAALESPPDLMLVDYFLPQMEGTTLIRQLKKAGVDCKFIIISGVSNIQDLPANKSSGISCFLLKPQPVKDLVEALREVLGQPCEA